MPIIPAITALLMVSVSLAGAQSVRSLIREGNELYGEEKYPDAEVQYRKALENVITSYSIHYTKLYEPYER